MQTQQDNARPDVAFPEDEYLTAEQVESLYGILTAQFERMVAQSREMVSSFHAEREQEADTIDLASSESNRESELRFADRERRLANKVSYALESIRNGEYGMCENCGGAIGYKRLLARPVARFCIDCKTQAEMLERRSRSF